MFKCCLGLSAEELPPDHTTLCRFRVRLGAEGFQNCSTRLEQARAQVFVSDRLHIIDATDIAAKVDLLRLKKEHAQGDDDDTYVERNSPDPEARFGRKSQKKGFYGYKAHIVEDADSELIVGVKTTPGNVPDGVVFPELIDGHPWEATGEKGYDSAAYHAHLEALGVASGIIRRRRPPGRPRNSSRERPKVERKFAEGNQRQGLKKALIFSFCLIHLTKSSICQPRR